MYLLRLNKQVSGLSCWTPQSSPLILGLTIVVCFCLVGYSTSRSLTWETLQPALTICVAGLCFTRLINQVKLTDLVLVAEQCLILPHWGMCHNSSVYWLPNMATTTEGTEAVVAEQINSTHTPLIHIDWDNNPRMYTNRVNMLVVSWFVRLRAPLLSKAIIGITIPVSTFSLFTQMFSSAEWVAGPFCCWCKFLAWKCKTKNTKNNNNYNNFPFI